MKFEATCQLFSTTLTVQYSREDTHTKKRHLPALLDTGTQCVQGRRERIAASHDLPAADVCARTAAASAQTGSPAAGAPGSRHPRDCASWARLLCIGKYAVSVREVE